MSTKPWNPSNKPVLTLDVDGVVAQGLYTARENRTPENYAALPVESPDVKSVLFTLSEHYSIYAVSSRSFPGCTDVTRDWFIAHGLWVYMSGVICNTGNLDAPEFKLPVLAALHSALHIDDDAEIIRECASVDLLASLYVNPRWEPSVDYYRAFGGFKSWQGILKGLRVR